MIHKQQVLLTEASRSLALLAHSDAVLEKRGNDFEPPPVSPSHILIHSPYSYIFTKWPQFTNWPPMAPDGPPMVDGPPDQLTYPVVVGQPDSPIAYL